MACVSRHCRYKTEVGQRLALAALKHAYNQTEIYAGPVFASASATTATDGVTTDSVTLHFNETGAEGQYSLPAPHNPHLILTSSCHQGWIYGRWC